MHGVIPMPPSILHIMRAPVGGLFRHVADLAQAQTERGLKVGIIADSLTGGDRATAVLDRLHKDIAFGVSRVPMSRDLGAADIGAVRHVRERLADTGALVAHGHGAKGGAYARLAAPSGVLTVYTPHGGSLHYSARSPVGFAYLSLERVLARRTGLFLFESRYGLDTFTTKVGQPKSPALVVHNGVGEDEFKPVAPAPDATDLVYLGELRLLKGVDVLLEACALLRDLTGAAPSLTLVGAGPDAARFESQANALQLPARFLGARPAREAFAAGRMLIVPSRAESLPYVVLEAAAAGVPVIASAVGGIGEIFGEDANRLVTPGDVGALAAAIEAARADLADTRSFAARLRLRVHEGFSVDAMTSGVLDGYATARQNTLAR